MAYGHNPKEERTKYIGKITVYVVANSKIGAENLIRQMMNSSDYHGGWSYSIEEVQGE